MADVFFPKQLEFVSNILECTLLRSTYTVTVEEMLLIIIEVCRNVRTTTDNCGSGVVAVI